MDPARPRSPLNPWPVTIIAFFACFITGAVGFIVFSTFHGSDLVSDDYYDREVHYQDQLDRVARTQSLQAEVQVTYDASQRLISITLPAEHARRQPTGHIHLYRPSAAHLDRHLELDLNVAGCQFLEAGRLAPGLWRVRINWTVDGVQYYADREVVITEPAG